MTGTGNRDRFVVLALLTLVYTFGFIDRQIIAVLSPAIKEDLGLTDTQLGLLKGFAFALLYSLVGVPVAWLADRYNRVSILSASLAIWSLFTAISSLAGSFVLLFLARVGIGLGEAGCTPPAQSILSDYFEKHRRATVFGIYSAGIPLGQALAFLIGGYVLAEYGWRVAFAVVGIPGLLLAVVVKLVVKEPARGAAEVVIENEAEQLVQSQGMVRSIQDLAAIRSYVGIVIAITLSAFFASGVGLWIVDYYRRAFDLPFSTITQALALVTILGSASGVIIGGAASDRLASKRVAFYALVPGIALLLAGTLCSFLFFIPNPVLGFVGFGFVTFCTGFSMGPSYALVQSLAPVAARALAVAIFLLFMNLIGYGVGPLWVGMVSDYLALTSDALDAFKIALASSSIFGVAGGLAFFWTSRQLPEDWSRRYDNAPAP